MFRFTYALRSLIVFTFLGLTLLAFSRSAESLVTQ